MPTKPLLIGLCGGIASGKSTIAKMLRKSGAGVIDADRIGHRLLKTSLIKKKLIETYGKGILTGTGSISRQRLSLVSFAQLRNLKRLNSIIHPFILKEIKSQIEKLNQKPLVILDAALLLETGLAKQCDYLIFVNTSRRKREQRAVRTRGWTKNELHQRERFQMPASHKKQRTDFVINNTSLNHSRQQVQKIFHELYKRRQI